MLCSQIHPGSFYAMVTSGGAQSPDTNSGYQNEELPHRMHIYYDKILTQYSVFLLKANLIYAYTF